MSCKMLGHTQVQTTARYAHLATDPVKQATAVYQLALRRRWDEVELTLTGLRRPCNCDHPPSS